MGMPFTVTNVICRFNSASGGPPRTVCMMSHASVGHWRAELFTTDYCVGAHDTLLLDQYRGHVNIMARNAQGVAGGLLRMIRLFRSYEAQLLRGVAPDLIHIHGVWSPMLAAFASSAVRNGIPYIVAPHGMLEPWSLNVHRLRKSLALGTYQGKLLADAAAIHATSVQEARHLRVLPCVRSPVYVVPNAVDFPPDAVANAAACATDAAPRTNVLLFLSRVHPKKGVELLLRAWNELRPGGWQLNIVGQGNPGYVAGLKRWCAERRVPGVFFLSHVDGDQREAMFREASALVLPTYSENFGNVVAEAMARGIPVITTTGTPWSALKEHRCGWYIEPTAAALQTALGELVTTDAQQRAAMGRRGRAYALKSFSIEAVRKALLQMYHGVLGRQSGPTPAAGSAEDEFRSVG